ncbi:hypothetical protein [Paenibacillus agilis]|uniref:Uncharacterized protein n=1 Tax=Paenibacillus agilis TaxID=3020863 RepID=A0A559J2H7_9BACL|nr:hypothetical protein [Paenibacillus agilis]TVX94087.1 hypothetical protein FPZ44_14105 [Paenibacillus agilis]
MKSSLQRWLVLSVSMLFVILIGISQTAYAAEYTYHLAQGESARVSSQDGKTITATLKGAAFDYAKTTQSKGANGYGKGTESSSHTVTGDERLFITNTSNDIVTIAVDQDRAAIVRSESPALVSRWLQPGESAEITNIGITDEYFYVNGKNDQANYDEYNMLQSYEADHKGGRVLLEIARKIAITNREKEAIEVYAPHSYFKIETRQHPAVFHRYIETNKTLEINNVSDNIYYIYFDAAKGTMQYDYVSYLNNEIDRYGNSSDSSRQIGRIKYVVTNKGEEPLHVYGPYEVFALYEREDFALETKTLKKGESMQIVNTSAQSHPLNFKGTYEFAEYDNEGKVIDFDKGVLSSSKSIDSGSKIIISNSSEEDVEIIGPKAGVLYETVVYPPLIVNKREQSISYNEGLAIGETEKASNKMTKIVMVTTNNQQPIPILDGQKNAYLFARPFAKAKDVYTAVDSDLNGEVTSQTVRTEDGSLGNIDRIPNERNGPSDGYAQNRTSSYRSGNDGQLVAVMNDS